MVVKKFGGKVGRVVLCWVGGRREEGKEGGKKNFCEVVWKF